MTRSPTSSTLSPYTTFSEFVSPAGDRRATRPPHRPRFDGDGLQRIGPVHKVAERGQPVQTGGPVGARAVAQAGGAVVRVAGRQRQDIDRMPLLERPEEEPGPNRDR